MTTLQSLLERYLRVPVEHKQKKSQKLNSFLNKFLSELESGTAPNIFRNMKSVCNILVGEFLVDVHQICEDCTGADTKPLQTYLLHGRGCVILKVLSTIGLQGISSGLELAELLVSILPLCLKFPRDRPPPDAEKPKLLDIKSSIFASQLGAGSPKKRNAKFPQISEVSLSKGTSSRNSFRQRTEKKSTSKANPDVKSKLGSFFDFSGSHKFTASRNAGASSYTVTLNTSVRQDLAVEPSARRKHEPSSSESEQESREALHPGMPLGIFRGLLSAPSSDAEVGKETEANSDEELVPLPDLKMDPFELCVLVISVVREICHEEHAHFVNTKLVSGAILTNIGELIGLIQGEISPLLSGLQTEEISEGWSELDYILIQRHLLRLVLSTMKTVALQANGCVILKNTQVLEILAELCNEMRKEIEPFDSLPHDFVNRKWKSKLEFVVEINEGLLLLFESILVNIGVNPSTISMVLQFLSDYMKSCGNQMLSYTILTLQKSHPSPLLSPEQYESLAYRNISIMSSLTLAMKRMKVSYIHTVKCSKKCHKMCDFSGWTNHHHDVLGISCVRSKLETSTESSNFKSHQMPCSIAVAVETLLGLLAKCSGKTVLLRIMCSLEECGVCCCITPETLTSYLLVHIESQTPAIRNYIFTLWTRFLLEQCGGSHSNEKSGSSIYCCVCDDSAQSNSEDGSKLWMSGLGNMSDSAFSSDDNFVLPAVQNKWDCLHLLGKFVFHEQTAISVQTMQHLLRLVCYGSVSLKRALFQHIVVPVFSRALPEEPSADTFRLRGTTPAKPQLPLSEKVTNYCLCALPLLLQCRDIYNIFINIGGIAKLCQYVSRDHCRKATLKALMVMVILEEKMKESEALLGESSNDSLLNASPKTSDADDKQQSRDVTQTTNEKSEGFTTDMLLKLLCDTGIDERDVESDVITEKDDVTRQDHRDTDRHVMDKKGINLSNVSVYKADDLASGSSEIGDRSESQSPHFSTEKLSLLCDLWDCGNVLFHQSHTFKHHFLTAGGTQQAYSVLERCLKLIETSECSSARVFHEQDSDNSFVCVLSLVRAVLSICMSSCNTSVLAGQWEVSTHDLVAKVKDAVFHSHIFQQGQSAGFKVMCDMLLSCASQQRLASDLLQNHVFTVMHLKCDEDVYSRRDIQELSESSSSHESEYHSLDQGYEADSEFTHEDSRSTSNKWSGMDQTRPRTFSPFPVTMPHPQFTHLVLDCLIQYTNRFHQTSLVSHVLLKMISIAKQNEYNAMAMYTQGLVQLILKRFQQVLRFPVITGEFPVELTLLLDLFLVISKHSFTSDELRMCLRLFQEENPPIDLLLHTLTVLAENLSTQPTYILCFPVITSTLASDLELTSKSLSGDTLSISVQVTVGTKSREDATISKSHVKTSQPAEDLALSPTSGEKEMKIFYKKPYAMRAAPIQFPVNSSSLWPVSPRKGFAVSMWLRMEGCKRAGELTGGTKRMRSSSRRPDISTTHYMSASGRFQPISVRKRLSVQQWTEQCLHVFSVGNDELMLEVWLDPESCSLVLRLLSCYLDGGEGLGVLADAAIPQICDTLKWHHLTLTFNEKIQGTRSIIMVSTVLDGCQQKSVEIDYSKSRIAYSVADTMISDNRVYLGHAVSPGELLAKQGMWQLGTFMLFEDLELTKHSSLYLCALGPSAVSLVPCDNGNGTVSFARFISEKNLKQADIRPYIFTGNHSVLIDQLKEKLFLVFDPRNPTQYQMHKRQTINQTANLSTKEALRLAFSHQPTQELTELNTDLAPQIHRGLRIAISEVGGIGTFLFLVAKVIGMETTEEQQSQAVKLLCTLLSRCSCHPQQLAAIDGYSMLGKALASTRCKLGYHMLKVLLDYCLTSSAVQHNKPGENFVLHTSNRALIQDANLISYVLLDWRVWENTRTEVCLLLFQTLENLVCPEHVHYKFNVAQLENLNIVKKLLNVCLERIQAEYPSLDVEIAKCVTSIIRHVVNESHDSILHHVISLWDFLLLVHPAANTYVHQGATDFYFHDNRHMSSLSKSSSIVGSADDKQSPAARSSDVTMANTRRYRRADESLQFTRRLSPNKDLTAGYVRIGRSDLSLESTDYDVTEATENGKNRMMVGASQKATFERSQSFPLESNPESKEAHGSLALSLSTPDFRSQRDMIFFKEKEKFVGADHTRPDRLELIKQIDEATGVNFDNAQLKECITGATPDNEPITRQPKRSSDVRLSDQDRNMSSPEEFSRGLIPSIGRDSGIPSFSVELPSTPRYQGAEDSTLKSPDSVTQMWRPGLEAMSLGSEAASLGSDVKDGERAEVTGGERLDVTDGESLDMESEFDSHAWRAYNDVEHDYGLHAICTGVLEIITSILVRLDEKDLKQIIGYVVKPTPLIVMANHCSSAVRAAIVKLLDVYLLRAPKEDVENVVKIDAFHLLANQLYQYPATQDVTEACFAILCGKECDIGEELDMHVLSEMSGTQKQAVVPILALLTKSVGDLALCHNVLLQLHALFANVPELFSVMLESGVCESLLSVVRQLNDTAPQVTDLGDDEKDILWRDVTNFIVLLVQKTFSSAGALAYQYLEDFFMLLTSSAHTACVKHGRSSPQEAKVNQLVCVSYKVILTFVNDKLDAPSTIVEKGKLITKTVGNILSRLNPVLTKPNPRESLVLNEPSTSTPRKGDPRRHSFRPTSDLRQYSSPLTRTISLDAGRKSSKLAHHLTWDTLADSLLGMRQMELTNKELAERFKKIVCHAVDFVMFSGNLPSLENGSEEEDVENSSGNLLRSSFPCFLLTFLKNAVVMGMEKSFFQRNSMLVSLFRQCREFLKIQFCRLYCHMISSSACLDVRLFCLACLADDNKSQQLVTLMAKTLNIGKKLVILLYNLLLENVRSLKNEHRQQASEVMSVLQQNGFVPIRLGTRLNTEKKLNVEKERRVWQREYTDERASWKSKTASERNRIDRKYNPLARQVSAHALEVTQRVSKAQSKERRKFIEYLKTQMANRLQTKKSWQLLIQQLTHERAVWFDEKSEPQSWQLDPTEGPDRIRMRLQKCQLGIQPRFLKPETQYKLDCEEQEPQLAYLFVEDTRGSDSKALIYKLHTSQNIQLTSFCKNVTPSGDTPGSLLIGQKDVYFVADEAIADPNNSDLLLGNRDILFVTLAYDDIKGFYKRWYQLQDNALEMFMINGKTCLFSFTDKKERDHVFEMLSNLELPNMIGGESVGAVQQLWLEGKMTNYEYLCHLNTMSGRSFNDLMQYPVFPFVLSQYTETSLDLCNPKSYRLFEKPIAVQHRDREQRYIDHYKWLELEQKLQRDEAQKHREHASSPSLYHSTPYHYGSHYSNSGSVLHFLVRLPPFTQMFLEYQDKNFDIPDRTFHDLATTWRLASFDSTTDVKELIPEFFYFPEFLLNSEGFNFGTRQNGQVVDNIHLPKWCEGDPCLFIKIHRQALESDHVTAHLHAWIDLVFGFKQQGKAAVEAVNVFHPATYFGVDVEKIPDVVNRTALKTAIATYGQTPKQLFKSNHPKPHKQSQAVTRTGNAPVLLPLSHIQGLKWGTYVGSPAYDEPKSRWIQEHGGQVSSLVSLPTGEVFGLGPCSHLLVNYSKDKGITGVRRRDVIWAAILSWAHPDSVIRVKNKKDKPAVNFMQWSADEQVTCCASVPDCRLLLFGASSGVITIYNTKFNPSKPSHMQVFGTGLRLYGHSAVVSSLYVCKPYSVFVSASHDRTLIIWDLNRLSYVRTIADHASAVQCVCVSDTSAEIASVSHHDLGSTLMLHTVNGVYRGKVTSDELIVCVTFSSEPEGRSINVVAAGLSNGRIRMWSSWNLMPVRDLVWCRIARPIVSLTFSNDNQRLFASAADGTVACWERPGYKGKEIVFIPFLN